MNSTNSYPVPLLPIHSLSLKFLDLCLKEWCFKRPKTKADIDLFFIYPKRWFITGSKEIAL